MALEDTIESKVAERTATLQAQLDKLAEMFQAQQAIVNPPPEPPDTTPRLYFSSQPFTTVHVMVAAGQCEAFQFINGAFETSRPEVKAELDKIVKIPGSGVSLIPPQGVTEEVIRMREDLLASAAVAHGKMLAAGEKTA
jgi:hypothetical protein